MTMIKIIKDYERSWDGLLIQDGCGDGSEGRLDEHLLITIISYYRRIMAFFTDFDLLMQTIYGLPLRDAGCG